MTFQVSIVTDVDRLRRRMTAVQRKQLPFALAMALTATAKDAKADVLAHMSRIFDRPTKWTMNALAIRTATKRKLRAEVYFKEFAGKGTPAFKYLTPHIKGGTRRQKRSERALKRHMGNRSFWVPGQGLRLNKHGNITGPRVLQIITGVGAAPVTDASQAITSGSRKRHRKRAQYFVPRAGSSLHPGVYQRVGRKGKIKPVLIFVQRVHYRKRFLFVPTIRDTVRRKLTVNFRRAFKRAMATRRP